MNSPPSNGQQLSVPGMMPPMNSQGMGMPEKLSDALGIDLTQSGTDDMGAKRNSAIPDADDEPIPAAAAEDGSISPAGVPTTPAPPRRRFWPAGSLRRT